MLLPSDMSWSLVNQQTPKLCDRFFGHLPLVLLFIPGTKLQLKSIPVATACVVYHKFFDICSVEDYDPYVSLLVLRIALSITSDYLVISPIDKSIPIDYF